MTWNKSQAVSSARMRAYAESQKRCAHFVTLWIKAGGINIPFTHYAKDMGLTLTHAGFYEVHGHPLEGDIAVIQPYPGGNLAGHACIYDGQYRQWISDFKQSQGGGVDGMYPGPGYRKYRPAFKIYRHD